MCLSGIEVREVIHIGVEGQMSLWVQAMHIRGKFTSQRESPFQRKRAPSCHPPRMGQRRAHKAHSVRIRS